MGVTERFPSPSGFLHDRTGILAVFGLNRTLKTKKNPLIKRVLNFLADVSYRVITFAAEAPLYR